MIDAEGRYLARGIVDSRRLSAPERFESTTESRSHREKQERSPLRAPVSPW